MSSIFPVLFKISSTGSISYFSILLITILSFFSNDFSIFYYCNLLLLQSIHYRYRSTSLSVIFISSVSSTALPNLYFSRFFYLHSLPSIYHTYRPSELDIFYRHHLSRIHIEHIICRHISSCNSFPLYNIYPRIISIPLLLLLLP